jgi:hypothetical protein
MRALASALGVLPELVRRLKAIAEGPRQPIDQETLENLGRTSLLLVERQVGDLARTRLHTLILSATIAAFAIGAACFGIEFAVRGDALDRACLSRGEIRVDKDGHRHCVVWLDEAAKRQDSCCSSIPLR